MRGLRLSLPGELRAGAPDRCFPGPARPTARPARPGCSLLFSFGLVRAASPAARLSSPPVWLQGQLGEGGVASCPLSNLRRWHQRTGRSFVIVRRQRVTWDLGGEKERGPRALEPQPPDPGSQTLDPRPPVPNPSPRTLDPRPRTPAPTPATREPLLGQPSPPEKNPAWQESTQHA